jgi:hypothetical protein
MYYAEQWFDGKLFYRTSPDGTWCPVQLKTLNELLGEAIAALARKDALLAEALAPVKYAAKVMPHAFRAMLEDDEIEQAKTRAGELDALAARIAAELGETK